MGGKKKENAEEDKKSILRPYQNHMKASFETDVFGVEKEKEIMVKLVMNLLELQNDEDW